MRREMPDGSAIGEEKGAVAPRRRVRTPGKHIVLFALAVTFMLGLSTTAIRSGVALPHYDLASLAGEESGPHYGPEHQFLADLSPDQTGRVAYVKLTARLIARDAAALAEIRAKAPQIEERIAFFLRELSPEDFEGSEGMARLKAEMLKRANLPLDQGVAVDVVIDNIIIQ